MPCLWLTHNNSQLFLNVGIIDATTIDIRQPNLSLIQVPHMFVALVDTGAQRTMISRNVVTTLNLAVQGRIPIQGVGPNIAYHNGYLFHVAFSVQTAAQSQVLVFVHPPVIFGAEFNAPPNFDVLLGMDILSTGSLNVEGSGHYSFSF